MSTTPTPVTTKTSFWKRLSEFPGFTWVTTHEKLIIIIILCFVGWHLYTKGLDAWSQYEDKQVAALQAQSAADKAATAAALKQDAADKATAAKAQAASNAMTAQVTAANAALAAAITARNAQTQQQQQTDLHATLPALDQRLVALVPAVNPQDIVAAPDGKSVTVGIDTASKTVVQLELVPELQQDLKDTQTENAGLQTEITSLQTYNAALVAEVATEDKTISLLQTEVADNDKTCTALVNAEKVKTTKAFWHGFKVGAIVGFIGGLFVGHAAAGL